MHDDSLSDSLRAACAIDRVAASGLAPDGFARSAELDAASTQARTTAPRSGEGTRSSPAMRALDGSPSLAREPLTHRRSGLWRFLAIGLAAWLVVVATASAQVTGSSAGGGDWGSSSSSSGSSSSSSSSSSGSSYGTAAGGASWEPSPGVQLLIVVAWLVAVIGIFWVLRRVLDYLSRPPIIDVARVQVAVDARARRFVQRELSSVVDGSDTRSREGLVRLLSTAARTLRSVQSAWIYGGANSFEPMEPDAAREAHARLALDARARFQRELVRAAEGTVRAAPTPDLVAREHEGEGVVVVTLVVAARGTLKNVDSASAAELDGLLTRLAAIDAKTLVAVELIWSPSAENDRMSTAELEAVYPELRRLAVGVGRAYCSHCGGPFAAELPKCPHCGAPNERQREEGTRQES